MTDAMDIITNTIPRMIDIQECVWALLEASRAAVYSLFAHNVETLPALTIAIILNIQQSGILMPNTKDTIARPMYEVGIGWRTDSCFSSGIFILA